MLIAYSEVKNCLPGSRELNGLSDPWRSCFQDPFSDILLRPCIYWMLAFRRGTVFQHKCFTLNKFQIRGGCLNTIKNVKYFNRKLFSEGLQQLTSQTWPAFVRIRGRPGKRFSSVCPLGSFCTFLWCSDWRQGRMWPCVYLVALSMVQVSTTQHLLCHGAHKAPLSGLCTLVCRVSESGRRYSESPQEGRMLCDSPSADTINDWYSVLTPWRAVCAHTDWQQYHSGGRLLRTGLCWKVEGLWDWVKLEMMCYSCISQSTQKQAKQEDWQKESVARILSLRCLCLQEDILFHLLHVSELYESWQDGKTSQGWVWGEPSR